MSDKIHQIKNYVRHFFSAHRKGHGVHSPFAYKLCEEVFYNNHSFYDFEKLNFLRRKLLSDQREIEIKDLGAGSAVMNSSKRKICDIAKHGISSQRQSEILFKLVNFLKPEIIVELGTSLGLNACYLAKANKNATVFTLEGSMKLAAIANENLKELGIENCSVVPGNFDTRFQIVLDSMVETDSIKKPALYYFDGNHTYEATLRYYKQARVLQQEQVMVFDDIYWSKEMTKAWKEIENDPAVTFSIDTFNFGIVFFREEMKEKTKLKLFI